MIILSPMFLGGGDLHMKEVTLYFPPLPSFVHAQHHSIHISRYSHFHNRHHCFGSAFSLDLGFYTSSRELQSTTWCKSSNCCKRELYNLVAFHSFGIMRTCMSSGFFAGKIQYMDSLLSSYISPKAKGVYRV